MANIVPMVNNPMEKTRGDIFSRLLEDNIIMLTGEINDQMAELVISQLLYLEAVDPNKEITMYINSPGGSCQAGFAIYDTMKMVKNKVSTLCIGLAASMASFLLAAGKECGGTRMITENSNVMIHQVLGGFNGQETDARIRYEQMAKTKNKLTTYLSKFSGNDYDKVYNDCERDHWLDAEEALEYGLVDEIVR